MWPIATLIAVGVGAVGGANRNVSGPGLIAGFRPPAVPLIVFDPYMSVWSQSDNLYDSWPVHWAGGIMALTGVIRVDGKSYRFMGPDKSSGGVNAPSFQQKSVQVFPLQTVYLFEAQGVELRVVFTTPSIPDDLALLSLPLTYITFTARSTDGKSHNVQLYYDNTAEVAVSDVGEQVTWDAVDAPGIKALRIGTNAQNILGKKGDGVKINWGYNYIATPATSDVSTTACEAALCRDNFVAGKPLPPFDNNKPRACNNAWPTLAITWDLGSVSADGASRRLTFTYDDIYSIDYFGERQIPYWRVTYPNARALLGNATTDEFAGRTIARCSAYENDVLNRLAPHGDKFQTLLSLAFRQTTGACKVVYSARAKGPWVYMKEISSDGDVSTVDVIYPASPFFIYLAPETLRLLNLPILAYANNETNIKYNLPWAPHHLGTWPICDIRPDEQEQMPMEETANMLVQLAAIAQLQKGDIAYLAPYWNVLQTWGSYLSASLPDPGNQLCTDDFEGPSPHNVNLAAKGIVGLAAWAILLKFKGDSAGAEAAMKQAQGFVQYWQTKAADADHFRLQYDLPNTWSQKYNLLFQRVLHIDNLFPQEVFTAEEAYYQTKLLPYGLPLDNRAKFTKTDWSSWMAALGTTEQFNAIFDRIYKFAHETPDRKPFTDWYWCDSGRLQGFVARPVIGGLYAKMIV